MLNIQHVTEVINHYHRNKGILKKIRRTEHPAIRATDEYLKSLKMHKDLLSNQDLFNINRIFLSDYPVTPGKASYVAWAHINYQNFCALNVGQVSRLAKLRSHPIPTKYSGFATCSKAGYQQFPGHFSSLSIEQLDKRSNAEKMLEYFQLLNRVYQKIKLNDNGTQDINLENTDADEIIFNEDRFIALSKLCVEGMLTQTHIDAILQSNHANFLAKSLIYLKHTDTLTLENQQFILTYSGALIIPVTHILVNLDKAGLNTLANREIFAKFSIPYPLHRIIKCLEKIGILTQENFMLISAEKNLTWLLALEEMPEELITPEIWQELIHLSKICSENELRKNIKDYAELLKKKLNIEQIEKDILASEEQIETQVMTSSTRFFSVTPANCMPPIEDIAPKVASAP